MITEMKGLIYCKHKRSNTGHCSNLAVWEVTLSNRGNEDSGKTTLSHRCDAHKNAGTTGKKVIEVNGLDQGEAIQKVNTFLHSLIGKRIKASVHTARELEVKYLKDNGGVMCLQPITKKWKYVYYNQIESILNP